MGGRDMGLYIVSSGNGVNNIVYAESEDLAIYEAKMDCLEKMIYDENTIKDITFVAKSEEQFVAGDEKSRFLMWNVDSNKKNYVKTARTVRRVK
jgi:hypothetical protein